MNILRLSLPLLSLALLAGCGRRDSHPGTAADAGPALSVRTQTLKPELRPLAVEVVGTVRPVQRALIASKVMGSVESEPPALGQRVRKDEVLLRISAAEIGARALQAQSQLNQVRRDLDRERELLTKGASTAEMVRSLEDRLAMTQGLVREAEAMVSYTSIRAPFDGVVSRRAVNAGDLASPGLPLLELEGLGAFQVEAGIPDSLSGTLSKGALLKVELSDGGLRLDGRLEELSSSADPQARTVAAKITLPSGAAVRSGQFARVLVPGRAVEQLLVPVTALIKQGQMEAVYLVDGDKRAVLRLVRSGLQQGDQVEITSGLSGGERLVVNPGRELREGRKLEVQP